MPEAKTRENVITKIQKLLALATSSNEHEAAAAMGKAQELLLKHNLSMAEIEPIGGGSPVGMQEVPVHTRATNKWLYILAGGIARTNFSQTLIGNTRPEDGNKRTARRIVFIGREENATVCCELLAWIVPQAESWGRREKRRSGNNSGHRNSYMVGLAEGIAQRLLDYRNEQEAQNVKVTALAIRHDKEIGEFLSGIRTYQVGTGGMRSGEAAQSQGYSDAAGISLTPSSRQVDGGRKQLPQ